MKAEFKSDLDLVSTSEFLTKMGDHLSSGNLKTVSESAVRLFKIYESQLLKLETVESVIKVMGLDEDVCKRYGGIEKFVMSHF